MPNTIVRRADEAVTEEGAACKTVSTAMLSTSSTVAHLHQALVDTLIIMVRQDKANHW